MRAEDAVEVGAAGRTRVPRRSRVLSLAVSTVVAVVVLVGPLAGQLGLSPDLPRLHAPDVVPPVSASVVPAVLRATRQVPPLVVDRSGRVRASRLSMAFVGTVGTRLGAYGVDAATGRLVRLPETSDDLSTVAVPPFDDQEPAYPHTSLSLSPDGGTLTMATTRPVDDTWVLALDLTTGTARSQRVTGADVGVLRRANAPVAALDGGRYLRLEDSDHVVSAVVSTVRAGEPDRRIPVPGAQPGRPVWLTSVGADVVQVEGELAGQPHVWLVDARAGTVRSVGTLDQGWGFGVLAPSGDYVGVDADARLLTRTPDGERATSRPLSAATVSATGAASMRAVAADDRRVVLADDGPFVGQSQWRGTYLADPATGRWHTLTRVDLHDDGVTNAVFAAAVVLAARPVSVPGEAWWTLVLDPEFVMGAMCVAVLLALAAVMTAGVRPRTR